jgi:hypothetical protein
VSTNIGSSGRRQTVATNAVASVLILLYDVNADDKDLLYILKLKQAIVTSVEAQTSSSRFVEKCKKGRERILSNKFHELSLRYLGRHTGIWGAELNVV